MYDGGSTSAATILALSGFDASSDLTVKGSSSSDSMNLNIDRSSDLTGSLDLSMAAGNDNLYSAKIMYLDNKFQESYTFLDHIIKYSDDIEIIDIAKYRKAKILIEEMNLSEAHSILGDEPNNYQHIELKGDIYYLEKNINEAVNYYNKALLYSLTPNERKNIKAKINLIK